MEYNEQDFLETAGPQTLKQIAKTRALTRKYNQLEHSDARTRAALLHELFGAIGTNVEIDTPFYCDHGKNIFIGNDVIININCTFVDNRPILLPGVTIGRNSVIGAGSVVTRSIPENSVAVGNPCRVIRRFPG